MALARKLNHRKKSRNLKIPQNKKMLLIGAIVLSLIIAVYGLVNLFRIAPQKDQKQELKYETGDRPLAQKTSLWVTAEGGLNMRKEPSSSSAIVILIPNGTALVAEKNSGDWYKVNFQEKLGWVSKKYVTTVPPAEDPIKNWQTYQNKGAGYSVRYPLDWVAQDYGANPATNSTSYVGLGAGLSPQLDPNNLPPIIIRQTAQTPAALEANYSKMSGFVSEPVTISGIAGKKYSFNSSSGVQVNIFVVSRGTSSYVFEETGGYYDDLLKIINTVILS